MVKERLCTPVVEQNEDDKISNVSSAVDNIYYPLSSLDWEKVCKYLKKVDGIMFYQILPAE